MKFAKVLGIILLVVVLGAAMADVVTSLSSSVSNDPSSQLVLYLKGLLWLMVLGIIAVGLVWDRLRSRR